MVFLFLFFFTFFSLFSFHLSSFPYIEQVLLRLRLSCCIGVRRSSVNLGRTADVERTAGLYSITKGYGAKGAGGMETLRVPGGKGDDKFLDVALRSGKGAAGRGRRQGKMTNIRVKYRHTGPAIQPIFRLPRRFLSPQARQRETFWFLAHSAKAPAVAIGFQFYGSPVAISYRYASGIMYNPIKSRIISTPPVPGLPLSRYKITSNLDTNAIELSSSPG